MTTVAGSYIVDPEAGRICATAARGASLTVRLKRILTLQSSEDSLMKRCLLISLLAALALAGIVRIQLVAREAVGQEPPHFNAELDGRVAELADKIVASDEISRRFKETLARRSGKIVVQDRAAHFAARLLEEARDRAIPGYLEERFERVDGKYALRDGQSEFRADFLATCQTFNSDVELIQQTLREMAARMSDASEIDRLVARFMQHEGASVMLYVQELRERLRPDETLIQRRLGELFVADENYEYMIRAGRRDEAAEHLERFQRMREGLKPLREELSVLAEEFSTKDDLNKRAKQLLAEPLFTALLAAQIFNEGVSVQQRLDGFFNEFSHLAVDTADGLAFVEEEPRQEIARVFEQYDRISGVARKLEKPVQAFVAKIKRGGKLEEGWREVLRSEIALLKLAEDLEIAGADAGQAIRTLLADVVHEGDDGKLHVREQEPEEVAEFIREMFRMYRNMRRKARVIDEVGSQLADQQLAAAFTTLGGKYVVLHSIQRSLAVQQFDGLSVWIDEHFETTDQGLDLREEAREEIKSMMQDARAVEGELANDDF